MWEGPPHPPTCAPSHTIMSPISSSLWLSVALLILVVARHSGLGALFLLPYLAWVGVAALLNWSIVRLNGPF